ncbi:intradiol ring-cleavage dioxygenase [Microcella daejeonensis]|uniref:intradiol ring-cleavage dioxygenase n=1 Tax=Microcella daejeonensis TaxID=2994971 RepID=UPI00226DC488|nr:intradiol ring-cleavage dioxygenase [Microcella daejeonensis]WAB83011.1 intradiol ring-cleavage dioxygenase [Microcella daejeonensis]
MTAEHETLGDAHEQAAREQRVTDEVVASFEGAGDARLQHLMQALTRHLHAFAREVRLTTPEWEAAIGFLTRAGHITDDRRQEFILLSDVLGLSMLTVGMNAPASASATESTVFGPFFLENSPEIPRGGDMGEGVKGMPCHVRGRVTGVDGAPIAGARVEVWGADEDGFYDVQYAGDVVQARAHLFTDANGEYDFWTVQPAAYPIPHDGPVGDLLAATNRSVMRPAHIHFMVEAEGFETLITHIFVAGDEWLGDDAVFGVKQSLILDFERHEPGEAPGRRVDEPWSSTAFDIVLAPTGA